MGIFRDKALTIWTTNFDFVVVVCSFVRHEASGSAFVARSGHKCSQGKNKFSRSDSVTVKLLQLQ